MALEELECRVLLSTSPGNPNAPLYANELPIGPAAISTLQQSSNQFPAAISSGGEFSPRVADSRASGLVFVHLHMPPTVADAPMLLVIGSPHTSDGSRAMSFAVPGQSMDSGQGDGAASIALGGQVTPFAAFVGASSPGGDEGIPATAVSLASAPAAPARAGAMGWLTFTPPDSEGSTSFSDPSGGQNWPMNVDVRRLDVTGTLDADQTTMTFTIPVGPLQRGSGTESR